MTDTTTIPLPDAAAWFGSPQWEACIREHDGRENKAESCPGCATGLFLGEIKAVMYDNGDDVFGEVCYLSDGFGSVGSMGEYDWSGIRDSSPAAIMSIVEYLRGEGLIR